VTDGSLRVAVVADTHLPRGTRRLPPRLLEECAAADLVLHAGDVCTRDVLIELGAYAPVYAVLGNNDDADVARVAPHERVVEAGPVRIGMIHDAGPAVGREVRLVRRFPGCHVVVYGHSHVPQVAWEGGVLILNPGSALERRRQPVSTMAVLDVSGTEVIARLVDLP
jgi:putative phosphoesterase